MTWFHLSQPQLLANGLRHLAFETDCASFAASSQSVIQTDLRMVDPRRSVSRACRRRPQWLHPACGMLISRSDFHFFRQIAEPFHPLKLRDPALHTGRALSSVMQELAHGRIRLP